MKKETIECEIFCDRCGKALKTSVTHSLKVELASMDTAEEAAAPEVVFSANIDDLCERCARSYVSDYDRWFRMVNAKRTSENQKAKRAAAKAAA